MIAAYKRVAKAVHGAVLAVAAVVIPLVVSDASTKVIVASGIGALLGVGGGVYATSNSEAPA